MTALFWSCLTTPVGPVSAGCSGAGVVRVRYGSPPDLDRGERAVTPTGADSSTVDLADAARAELAEYFRGERRVFGVPVDWSATSGRQRDVLTELAGSVGYGQTITYGALARRAGLTGGGDAARRGDVPARAVGSIMAANPIPVIVPCHRVVASDGIGGYSGGAGIEVKRWLLILEGSLPPTLDWAL